MPLHPWTAEFWRPLGRGMRPAAGKERESCRSVYFFMPLLAMDSLVFMSMMTATRIIMPLAKSW